MSGRPFRVGIIGLGDIGKIHARALSKLPDFELVAVAGSGREWLDQEVLSGVEVQDDYHELLSRDDIDIVSICSPSGCHAPQAMEALNLGKHVVVEKPMAMTVEEGRRVLELARRSGLSLWPIAQRRLEPQNIYVKEAIASGAFGRPVLGETLVRWYREQSYYDQADWRGTWANDGGSLMNQGLHTLDLLCWFMGPVQQVSGAMDTIAHDIEAEDIAVAWLRFVNGALGVVVSTTCAPPGLPAEVNLFFERGSIAIHHAEVVHWTVPGPPPPAAAQPGSGASDPGAIGVEGHLAQWRDVLECVRSGRPPLVTPEDALSTVALVSAVYEAARSSSLVTPDL